MLTSMYSILRFCHYLNKIGNDFIGNSIIRNVFCDIVFYLVDNKNRLDWKLAM